MPQIRYEKALLTYSWEENKKLIERLARLIKNSGYPVNQIFCIAKGGIPLGYALAIKFGLPVAIIAVESYVPEKPSGTTEAPSSEISRCREIALIQEQIGSHALLVDDLTETGRTFPLSIELIKCRFPDGIDGRNGIQQVKTATIWHKRTSLFQPTWFTDEVQKDPLTNTLPYIVQPHEQFSPQDLERPINTLPPSLTHDCIVRRWPEYTTDTIQLAQLVKELERKEGIKFNQIIALTSGGTIPGIITARILGIKNFAILATKNLPGIPSHVPFARDLVKTTPGIGQHILLIDDRTWTPTTLEHSIQWLKKEYGWAFLTLHTAVLYHGPQGFSVDIAVHEIDPLPNGQMPRLIQPMESEFQPFGQEAS